MRGTWREGSFYWGPRKICSVKLWKWASVAIGDPLLRNIDGRSFPRAFEKRDKFLYLGNFYKESER